MKQESGGLTGLLLLRRITPLTRRNAVYFCSGAYKICDELADEEPPSLIGFKVLLHRVLDRLFPQPHYPKETTEVELLVAVRENSKVHLFGLYDSAFAEVTQHHCIGSGIVSAKAMLKRYCAPSQNLWETSIIATYVLHHVKRWVDGCGGESDIFLLPSQTKELTRLPKSDVGQFEGYFDDFDSALQPILIACPKEPANDAAFKQLLGSVTHNLWTARSRFQDFDQVLRRVAGQLGLSVEDIMGKADEAVKAFNAIDES